MVRHKKPGRKSIALTIRLEKAGHDPWYAYEKFEQAVHTLATHRGTIRDRLWHAALDFASVSVGDVPEPLRPKFEQIKKDMSRLKPNAKGQSHLGATVSRVRLATCDGFASQIVELACQLRSYVELPTDAQCASSRTHSTIDRHSRSSHAQGPA